MTDVVLGRTRWRRRRALARLGYADVDVFGRPHYVFLTDSQRKRKAIASTAQVRDTFEPDAHVHTAWLLEAWRRWGDGRALWTPRQLDALGRQAAALHLPGPTGPWGRQLAGLLRAEQQKGQRASVSTNVREALDALHRLANTAERVSPSTALRKLADHLEKGRLDDWVRRLPPVVVDDILEPSPLLVHVLTHFLAAVERVGGRAAVSFECGADAGPDSLPAFFGAEEQTGAGRALVATRAWRSAIFERFVARGTATLHLAQDDGPVPIEQAQHDEAPDLTDGLAAPGPVDAPWPEGLAFRCFPDPAEEVRAILAELVQKLEDGIPPSACLVAVTDPDRYRLLLDAELARIGLDVDRTDGVPLLATPVGQATQLALRDTPLAPLEWCALAALVGRPPHRVRAALRPAGVHRGPPGTWRGRLVGFARRCQQDVDPLLAELEDLEGLRIQRQLPEDGAPAVLHDRVLSLLEAVGVRALEHLGDQNAMAWGVVADVLATLAAELSVTDAVLSTSAFLDAFLHALSSKRLYTPGHGRVPVSGVLELRGLSPQHTWILGATRTRWPAAPPTSPFLSPREAQRLAHNDRLAEARYTLASAIRNLAGATEPGTLTISWPAQENGRPTVMSRVVAEILERESPDGERLSRHLTTPVAPLLQRLPAPEPALTGHLSHPPERPKRLGVTAAETAMRCPARYWYQHVLRLRPEDPWDPELEPRRRGTALHQIFQEVYEERNLLPLPPTAVERTAQDLRRIADRVLDEVEAEGGFEPALQAWARGRWLAGLTDDRPKGLLAAWLDAEIERGIAPHAVEHPIRLDLGGVTLVGTVDRIDEHAGVLGVTDYKTGQSPSRKRVERNLALQSLVYLQALAADRPAASAFQLVGRPDTLRFAGWFGDPEAIRVLGGARGLEADADERRTRLEEVRTHLLGVLDGHVAPTVWGEDLAGCEHCPFHRVCRVRHDREPPC